MNCIISKLIKRKQSEDTPSVEWELSKANKELWERMLHMLTLFEGDINKLCGSVHQFSTGLYVDKYALLGCLTWLDWLREELAGNYSPKAKAKCRWDGELFKGYFAKSRETHYTISNFSEEIMKWAMERRTAMIKAFAMGGNVETGTTKKAKADKSNKR